MKSYDRVKAVVSLDAIAENMENMHKMLKTETQMIAVIKANGYGHGAVPIARLLEPLDYIWGFATATAEEASSLRREGVMKPVLVLGIVFPDSYEDMIRMDVRMTVSEYEMAKEISEIAGAIGKTAKLHLAVDTGMTRIGFADQETSIPEIQKVLALPGIQAEGMFTHFSRADETDFSPALLQIGRFYGFRQLLTENNIRIPFFHMANSAAIMRRPQESLPLVRAGITIYGIYPSEEVERELLPLLPSMEIKSRISFVKEVPAGCGVSYGATFVTKRPMKIATVPVGYADGYCRGLSNRGYVLIHGKRAGILGRICMDQFMVDVTEIPEVKRGDAVTLLGRDGEEQITMELLGELSGRFSYEFACEITSRVPRKYIYKGKEYTERELPL